MGSASTVRILVLSDKADVLHAVGAAAQPKGYLLFQVEGPADLAHRLHDRQPDLLVVDAAAAGAADPIALAEALGPARANPQRPQVLLVASPEAAARAALAQALEVDVLVNRPVDLLEMSVEVHTLVRVRRATIEAARDRDLLDHLLELSTLSENGSGGDEVLGRLAARVAHWLAMPHVAVSLGQGMSVRIAAAWHAQGGIGTSRSLVDRRHHEVVRRGDCMRFDAADAALTGEDPATLPYVGVPLRAPNGEHIGVLHAWGGERRPSEAQMRLLRVTASRIATEIQLRDSHRRLEEMVEARTVDLTALLDRVRGVNNQLIEANRETIMRLARAAEYRDGDTGEHVDRMSSYCQVLARRLGMSADDVAVIKLAAPMHDVGKIGIPDAILRKRGKLTPEEWDVMRQHPLIGAQILSGSGSKLLQMAEQIAATHHEKWDGSGYPLGLTGQAIPLVGRIVALADVFDALTSPRVYKDAWSIDESVAYIQGLSGKHFDPRVVDAFVAALDDLLEIRATYSGVASGEADVLVVTGAPGEVRA